jgi:hypothetical protein
MTNEPKAQRLPDSTAARPLQVTSASFRPHDAA